MKSLPDVLVAQLRDLLDVEVRLTQALPKLAKGVPSPKVKAVLEEQLAQVKQQVSKLQDVFVMLNVKAGRKKSEVGSSLVEEGLSALASKVEPVAIDATVIAVAQKLTHYAIASYGNARSWAKVLGHTNVAEVLHAVLVEKTALDKKLIKLSTGLSVAVAAKVEAKKVAPKKVEVKVAVKKAEVKEVKKESK